MLIVLVKSSKQMPDKLKILFCDVDGCLNSGNYIKRLDGAFDDPKNQMDPEAVARLNKITDATGAVIVVSSTWRRIFAHSADPLRQLQDCFKAYGITAPVIGMTPNKQNAVRNRRGKEIQAWLDDNYDLIDKFVIIDDDSDMGKLHTKQVKTLFEDGLQDQHVTQIIDLLK